MANLKLIRYMQATEDGVIYYSPSGTKACMTTLEPEGVIKRTLIGILTPSFPKEFIKSDAMENSFSYWKVLIFDLLLLTIPVYFKDLKILSIISLFALFISLDLFKLFHVIYEMKISKRLHSIARYTGASHMVSNAYLKLQRIPTLEEAKKCSRFSTDSLITRTFYLIITRTVLLVIIMVQPTIKPLILLIVCVVLSLLLGCISLMGAFNFLQIFVTAPPSDEELNVAIEGIKCYEDMEKNVEVVVVEK